MRYGLSYTLSYNRRRPKNEVTTVVECNLNSSPFVTHSYAQGQRQLKLKTEIMGTKLVITAPPNGNVAPPQYYMLFLVVNGIPSRGKWVQVTA